MFTKDNFLECPLCNQPVPLESAKTDEHGHAIHEECYLLKVRLEGATASRTTAKLAITCAICHEPVDFEQERYADENGQIVHEQCYMNRVLTVGSDPPAPQHTE